MKKLAIICCSVLAFIIFNDSVSAQSTGRIIRVVDPETGRTISRCYEKYIGADCVAIRTNQPTRLVQTSRISDHDDLYVGEEPRYQKEERKYVHQDLEVGAGGYRRLPSITYRISTGRETYRVETNLDNPRPRIYIDGNGNRYYYRTYYRDRTPGGFGR